MNEIIENSKLQVRNEGFYLKSITGNRKYKLEVKHQKRSTKISLRMPLGLLTTSDLPLTKLILDNLLPSIFKCKCFNDGELPFKMEVNNTETGHLFEHILLENLCEFKIKSGCKKVTYCGETQWNWRKEKRGIFNITVNVSNKDRNIFYPALKKTIELFDFIIDNGRQEYDQSSINDWYSLLSCRFLCSTTS